jgi:protein-tyrosine phosphatase
MGILVDKPADGLRQQVEFVDQQRRAGLPVYVHCAAGVSRSAMVVAAYLMARDGCTRDQALAALRARRPIIGPNLAFMPLLLEWEQTVKAARAPARGRHKSVGIAQAARRPMPIRNNPASNLGQPQSAPGRTS